MSIGILMLVVIAGAGLGGYGLGLWAGYMLGKVVGREAAEREHRRR